MSLSLFVPSAGRGVASGCRFALRAGIEGRQHGSLSVPTSEDSRFQRVSTASDMSFPFSDGATFAVHNQHMILPSVVGLFARRGPSAIVRLVIAVVVDAIDGVARWAQSHIRVEISERIAPPIADRNASFPVSIKFRIVRVETTPLQRMPRLIGFRFRQAVRRGPFSQLNHGQFAGQTATTVRSSTSQRSCGNRSCGFAYTDAIPVNFPTCRSMTQAHDLPSSKLASDQRWLHLLILLRKPNQFQQNATQIGAA